MTPCGDWIIEHGGISTDASTHAAVEPEHISSLETLVPVVISDVVEPGRERPWRRLVAVP